MRDWPDLCVESDGRRYPNGYGFGEVNVGRKRYAISAHRMSYEMHVGPIPPGMFICHSCDNRSCINPKHLWVGTRDENMADMVRKSRAVSAKALMTHCGLGHPIDGILSNGRRYCSTCRKRRGREWARKKRVKA